MQQALSALPSPVEMSGSFVRLVIEYPRHLEMHLDEAALRRYAEPAFEFHLIRRPQMEARLRLPNDQTINSLTPFELLELYWKTIKVAPEEAAALQKLAVEILSGEQQTGGGV